MKVCLLTSGSIGNAIVIEDEQESILIDCGISYKKFDELISLTSLDVSKIKDMLITHEHADHIKGVGVVSRKLNLQVWGTFGTTRAIYEKGILKETDLPVKDVEKYQAFEVADFIVTAFPLSHDAADPVGYVIEKDGKKVVCLTDTGYVSREVMNFVKGANIYLMEMNHNVDLLLSVPQRPWPLKQRILSDNGHLSNEDGAYIFSKLMTEETRHVFLSHISQEANTLELALATMKSVLKEYRVDMSKLSIHMTYPMRPTDVVEI